jgi:hypothetical protein
LSEAEAGRIVDHDHEVTADLDQGQIQDQKADQRNGRNPGADRRIDDVHVLIVDRRSEGDPNRAVSQRIDENQNLEAGQNLGAERKIDDDQSHEVNQRSDDDQNLAADRRIDDVRSQKIAEGPKILGVDQKIDDDRNRKTAEADLRIGDDQNRGVNQKIDEADQRMATRESESKVDREVDHVTKNQNVQDHIAAVDQSHDDQL